MDIFSISSLTMKVNSKKIKFELDRLGWSMTKLALESGMTKQAISILIKRETAPLKTLNNIGEALNIDPKDLLI